MVNVFQRLTRRRAQSSGSNPADIDADSTGPNSAVSHPHGIHRTVSTSSGKRSWRYEEPAPRHLFLISDTVAFDTHVVHRFQAEGFDVIYIPFLGSGNEEKDAKALTKAVHDKEDELENGERYAIIGTSSIVSYVQASLFEADTSSLQYITETQLTLYSQHITDPPTSS